MKINTKELLKQLNWDSTRTTGDMIYQKLSDRWGDFEEVVVENLPKRLKACLHLREGSLDKEPVALYFEFNEDRSEATLLTEKSTDGPLDEQLNRLRHRMKVLSAKPIYWPETAY